MPELVYIIAWFVLPLIPAFLLFKYLPSTGGVSTPGKEEDGKITESNVVKGPLKGLAIKFGGAFAGYLVLFLLSKSVLSDFMKKPEVPKDLNEIWTIKGSIKSEDNRYEVGDEKPEINIDPLPLDHYFSNENFDVKVVAVNDGRGYLNFPRLDFKTMTYRPESLPDLDFNKLTYNIDSSYKIENKESRIISLKKPLGLHLKTSVLPPVRGEMITVFDTAR